VLVLDPMTSFTPRHAQPDSHLRSQPVRLTGNSRCIPLSC